MPDVFTPPADLPETPLRRRVLKSGLVMYGNRSRTASVTVHELTDTNARLHCGLGALIPGSFELLIDFDGLLADCEVMWRTSSEIGVRILGTSPVGDLRKRKSGLPKLAPRSKLRQTR